MSTERRSSSSDNFAAFAARLCGLSADRNPDDLSNALRAAIKERELYDAYVSSLVGDKEMTMALLEVFDKVRSVTRAISRMDFHHRCTKQALTSATYDVTIFEQFWQLCGRTGLLPTSHILPERCIQTTEHPAASGGFGDVWEGTCNDKLVAIKALRVHKGDDIRKVRKVSHPIFLTPLDACD